MKNIEQIAKKLGIKKSQLYVHGPYIAKLLIDDKPIEKKKAKLVLVTAMTPTKAGEGKTTTSIGLTDGLNKVLKKQDKVAVACLRQPSMGPLFGMKGGATGGGLATVEPSDNINVHFTGDLHAISSASLLIGAMIENEIYQGNSLNIDPQRIVFPRALDVNDRSLREIDVMSKTGKDMNKTVITAASEIMTIFCLAKDKDDFLKRLGNITVAFNKDGDPIYLRQLRINNALWLILKDAFYPNIVQTRYGSPALVHGGPFANIAHGCCTYRSLKVGMENADYCITEAGFGADLGGEKFMDILCNVDGLKPDLTVMVCSVRALKLQGGAQYADLDKEDTKSLLLGLPNLLRHLKSMKSFGVPIVVSINRFATDTKKELSTLKNALKENGYEAVEYEGFAKGEKGGVEIAKLILDKLESTKSEYSPLYPGTNNIKKTIKDISTKIYGAKDVEFSETALKDLESFEKIVGYPTYVCIAKTPLSFSDDPKVMGAPNDFVIHVQGIDYYSGANLVVVRTGAIWLMPGLPKVPAAVKMEGDN